MEQDQNYSAVEHPPDLTAGGLVRVFGCSTWSGGVAHDCVVTFFTSDHGIIFNALTYKNAIAQGSVRLRNPLSRENADANGLTRLFFNIDPITAILGDNALDQVGRILWVVRYLQFKYDHPGNNPLPGGLGLLSNNLGISVCIDLHTIAHFFEVVRLQTDTGLWISCFTENEMTSHLLIVTENFLGEAHFKPYNNPSLLEHVALAVERAVHIVPGNSNMWFPIARFYFAMLQVLYADGGDQARRQISRLARYHGFASAWTQVSINARPLNPEGIFPPRRNAQLLQKPCACRGCSKIIWRGDFFQLTNGLVAAGVVQKYALVNPFDGYRSMFCDFCRQGCGSPWGTNVPRAPHN